MNNQNQIIDEIREKFLLAEEKTLLQDAAIGSSKALNKLICANLRFVIKVALLYRGQGLDITDLKDQNND